MNTGLYSSGDQKHNVELVLMSPRNDNFIKVIVKLKFFMFFHHSHKLHSPASLSNGIQRGQRVHHIRPQIIQQRDPSDWLDSMDNTVTHTAQSCGCRALLVEKVGRGGGVQKVFVLQGSYLRHYSFLSCERRRNDRYVG